MTRRRGGSVWAWKWGAGQFSAVALHCRRLAYHFIGHQEAALQWTRRDNTGASKILPFGVKHLKVVKDGECKPKGRFWGSLASFQWSFSLPKASWHWVNASSFLPFHLFDDKAQAQKKRPSVFTLHWYIGSPKRHTDSLEALPFSVLIKLALYALNQVEWIHPARVFLRNGFNGLLYMLITIHVVLFDLKISSNSTPWAGFPFVASGRYYLNTPYLFQLFAYKICTTSSLYISKSISTIQDLLRHPLTNCRW